jgi:hypothetical protein
MINNSPSDYQEEDCFFLRMLSRTLLILIFIRKGSIFINKPIDVFVTFEQTKSQK